LKKDKNSAFWLGVSTNISWGLITLVWLNLSLCQLSEEDRLLETSSLLLTCCEVLWQPEMLNATQAKPIAAKDAKNPLFCFIALLHTLLSSLDRLNFRVEEVRSKNQLSLGRADLCCTFLQRSVSYLDKANG